MGPSPPRGQDVDLSVSVCWVGGGVGGGSPVQELPVLASPLVPEFLSVHASNTVKVRLVDPKQAKAIHLPVTWWGGGTLQTPGPERLVGSRGHSNMLVIPWTLGMIWVLEEVPRGQA